MTVLRFVFIIAGCFLLLMACTPEEPNSSRQSTAISQVTSSPTPTATKPIPTDTPIPPTDTPTSTPTLPPTPTSIITQLLPECPVPTPEPLWIEPVTSPTDQLSQTIIVYLGNGEEVTIETESGIFSATGNFNSFASPAKINIALLPNTIHHLRVSGRVRAFGSGLCKYDGYTLHRRNDRFGNPLTIVQQSDLVTKVVTITPTPVSDDQKPVASSKTVTRKGVTWGKALHDPMYGIDKVSCHGNPQISNSTGNSACNPYQGDTSCAVALPILCIKIDNSSRPNYAVTGQARAMPKEFYSGWAGGHIALTGPIPGTDLTSLDVANALCAATFGDGYRMAAHDDGKYVLGMDEGIYYDATWPEPNQLLSGGWGFYAYGNISGQSRFWIHIGDQPGNCWNEH